MATTTIDLAETPPARLDIPVLRAVRPGVELRADGADGDGGEGPGTMAGHFSVFNRWFEINSWFEGHFLERTAPGSFSKTFNDWRSATDPHRIQVLLEHGYDPTVGDKPLGIAESLSEDKTGPAYEVSLFNAGYVLEIVPALRAGVYSASYRFRVIQDEWNHDPGVSEHNPEGIPERTIREQHVFEFGPTVFPANPSATAGMRSLTDEYYERMHETNPRVYDEMVRRATILRTPAADGTGAAQHQADEPPSGTQRSPRYASQMRRRTLAKKWSESR